MTDNTTTYSSFTASSAGEFSDEWCADALARLTEIRQFITSYVGNDTVQPRPDQIVYMVIAAVVERNTAPSNERTPEDFYNWARGAIGYFDAVGPPKGSQIDRLLRRMKLELGDAVTGAARSSDESDKTGANETADQAANAGEEAEEEPASAGSSVFENDKGTGTDGKRNDGLEDTGLSGNTELRPSAVPPTLLILPANFVGQSSGQVVVHSGPLNPLLVPLRDEEDD
ncbi:hypothetical protein FKW77_000100 [Venturia effusa]|uniref:Uncharacterized protein n=1 Tax=Venturia effusa TaxID=50376 RepID=A0A517L2H1_9PEZI|nr:hypothetical protein FKW77_000100 [Venturia effusa]